MQGVARPTLYMLGDSDVGKTTIARSLFDNLVFVGATEETTEFHAYHRGRDVPIRILEIRDPIFLVENEIELDGVRDVAIFCYAIDDPDSYQHVDDTWIPLFRQHGSSTLAMVLIGNKIDLRDNPEVVSDLAARGLQPVSEYDGNVLLNQHDGLHFFVEMEDDDSVSIHQLNLLLDSM